MTKFLWHVVLPSVAPLALLVLYFTPNAVFGCANRGYMALAVALLSSLAAAASAMKTRWEQRAHSENYRWWMLSTLLLILPSALLIGPLR